MSLFGEIAEPSTRTAWEDWDDGNNTHLSLMWRVGIDIPQNINTFVVIEGKYLTDYVHKRSTLQLEMFDSIPEVNLSVYRSKQDNNYICFLKDYGLLLSSEIIELLKDFIVGSKNIIVVQSKPLAEYQVKSQLQEDCVIRTISTSTACPNKYLKLEQPNIMSGVGAGALALREHLDLPGTAYVCYVECTEEYNIEQLQNLFGKLGIKHNNKPVNKMNTNLYI